MPNFVYQAQNADGSLVKGTIEGPTLDAAAQDLARMGLRVTQLGFPIEPEVPPVAAPVAPGAVPRPAPNANPYAPVERGPAPAEAKPYDYSNREAPAARLATSNYVAPPAGDDRTYLQTSVVGPVVGQVPIKDLTFFFRQCATMLHAGVGMVQTLNTLASQTHTPKLATILREVSRESEAGKPMSSVFQRYPEVFSTVVLSMLRAGEQAGFLDEALKMISDYLEQELKLRNLYKRLTFWPKLELGFSMVIIVVANLIIGSINEHAQKLESPLTTLSTWFWLAPLIIGIFLFFKVGLANPDIKYNWDMFVSKIPYLGATMRQLVMARFGRAFAALYKAGLPMQSCLLLAADACGNEYLRAQMKPVGFRLQQGEGLARVLAETNAFNPIVLDMIATGETSGNLDQMLSKVADYYIDEAEARQYQLAMIVGVVVSICTCIYIGSIIINFYTGYFANVTSAANGGGAGN